MNTNIEQARHNMIDNQVRTWDVLDPRVLDTLGAVQREDFVPQAFRGLAFVDMAIPLGHGEVMLKPVVEGRLLQAIALDAADEVLEIGTGSGYLTACMASMAGHVTSIDIHEDFTTGAAAALKQAGIHNVSLRTGDAVHEFQPKKAFDVVVVGGAVPSLPRRILSWIKPGGRAFVVCGQSPAMTAMLVHHEGQSQFRKESLFETDLPWLVNAAPEPQFTF